MKGVLPKVKVFGYSALLDALSAEKQSIDVKIRPEIYIYFSAFGNAKTRSNDNSSRFVSHHHIHFYVF